MCTRRVYGTERADITAVSEGGLETVSRLTVDLREHPNVQVTAHVTLERTGERGRVEAGGCVNIHIPQTRPHIPQTRPHTPRRSIAAMRHLTLTIAAALILAGCSGGGRDPEPVTVTVTESASTPVEPTPTESATFTIRGSITVNGEGSGGRSRCYTDEGYDDIQGGTDVVVTAPNGNKIAIGSLESGRSSGRDCVFGFTVEDVPEDVSLYTVEVGDRGELTYKRDELDGGYLRLTLG